MTYLSMCRYMDRQGEEQEGVATMFAATEARNGGWALFKSNLAQRMFFLSMGNRSTTPALRSVFERKRKTDK